MVDIYRDAKRRGIYPPLFTDPEGDSCFSSIYQIRWIKNAASLMAIVFDRTHTIEVVFQPKEFYDVSQVLITDARSFQALAAISD